MALVSVSVSVTSVRQRSPEHHNPPSTPQPRPRTLTNYTPSELESVLALTAAVTATRPSDDRSTTDRPAQLTPFDGRSRTHERPWPVGYWRRSRCNVSHAEPSVARAVTGDRSTSAEGSRSETVRREQPSHTPPEENVLYLRVRHRLGSRPRGKAVSMCRKHECANARLSADALNLAATETSVSSAELRQRRARPVVPPNRWRPRWRAERSEGGGPTFISSTAGPM